MHATIIRGNKTEEELKEYIRSVKRVYEFFDDEITVVNTDKEANALLMKTIKEF